MVQDALRRSRSYSGDEQHQTKAGHPITRVFDEAQERQHVLDVRRIQELIAGTRLVREWQGIEHCITVLADGYEYQGRPYGSLSAVARAITGTRWNGLVFFGLKNQRRRG